MPVSVVIVALIVAVPSPTAVTVADVPLALTVATSSLELVQTISPVTAHPVVLTLAFKSRVSPSSKSSPAALPVAVTTTAALPLATPGVGVGSSGSDGATVGSGTSSFPIRIME